MPLLTEGIVAFRNAASAATTHNATQPFGAHIQTQQYAVLQVSFFSGATLFLQVSVKQQAFFGVLWVIVSCSLKIASAPSRVPTDRFVRTFLPFIAPARLGRGGSWWHPLYTNPSSAIHHLEKSEFV